MSDSILPPSSSDLEQRLESAISAAYPKPIAIDAVWNPQTCPIEILPYLAWALSVDNWSSDWPEETKRRVVGDSLRVHKLKGTRPAVELACAAFGDVSLVEWFEETPKLAPGTFFLKARVPESGFLESNLQEIKRAVNQAKNARSHLTHVRLTHEQSAGVFMTAVLSVRDKIQVYPME